MTAKVMQLTGCLQLTSNANKESFPIPQEQVLRHSMNYVAAPWPFHVHKLAGAHGGP